jgi:hypothetical protein
VKLLPKPPVDFEVIPTLEAKWVREEEVKRTLFSLGRAKHTAIIIKMGKRRRGEITMRIVLFA